MRRVGGEVSNLVEVGVGGGRCCSSGARREAIWKLVINHGWNLGFYPEGEDKSAGGF